MDKLKKIQQAEDLCASENRENIQKALKIYKELAMSANVDPFDKCEVIKSVYKHIPEEGKELVIMWRDMTPYIGNKDMVNHTKLLLLICQTSEVEIHERSITATYLYNYGFLDICYHAFEAIAFDESAPINYRADACRFLFGSEIDENKEIAQECLMDIILDSQIPSKDRYSIIAGFLSKTGISTFLNMNKIKVPYDEEFVYALQMAFFESPTSDVREKILSGQHILSMTTAPSLQEKDDIAAALFKIAENEDYEENIRADAADVMLRLGTKDQIQKARDIIIKLGYSGLGKKEGMLDRVKTIYNNAQNMHDEKIADSVSKFIEKIVEQSQNVKLESYGNIQTEVVKLLGQNKTLDPKEKHSAKAALHRVGVDTATFTKYNVSISDIFIMVWTIIKDQKDRELKSTLENRMIEELVDMGETCSSGHSGRFVNVLSMIDPSISISFESQINANIAGRINARVRDIPDRDQKAAITSGMLPDASSEDKEAYRAFIDSALTEIKKELHAEFVDEQYIENSDFEAFFELGSKQWIDYKL